MSADAFAAALGKGCRLDRPGWGEALRTGAIFGSIEMATPVIGWALGRAASNTIEAFDHWIAFGLLLIIGGKMIWDAVRRHEEDEKPQSHSFWVLAATAVGTSIDALAVGVTLALIDANIVVNALAIGAAIAGRVNNHAIAIWASFAPLRVATSSIALRIFSPRASRYFFTVRWPRSLFPRSASLRYLPLRNPAASA